MIKRPPPTAPPIFPPRRQGIYTQIGSHPAGASNVRAVLRLEGVTCARQGRTVVDRVTLSVAAGQVTLLRGARGAGKSTLLAIAAAVIRPGAGRVFIADRDILALQSHSLPFVRRNIGYLPPEPPLVADDSAIENVMLALAVRGHDVTSARTLALDSLRAVGLPATAVDLPVKSLSLGERRLVAVARAVVGAPPLIVLDEPAAGLDADDREAVAMAMGVAQSSGSAVICGTAEPSFAALLSESGADIVELQAGRLVGGPRMTVLRGRSETPALEHNGALQEDQEFPTEIGDDDLAELEDSRGTFSEGKP